jgi:uncharacterized protein YecE (DUF72 family)
VPSEIKIGCCGFPMAQAEYFRHFDVVEVQTTFYQPPALRTAEKWRSSAPPGFEFTLKAWQLITHEPTSPTYRRLKEPVDPARYEHYGAFRPTEEVLAAWQRTAEFTRASGATLVLFQSPASFRPGVENVANLRRFFSGIRRGELRLAWEPRGAWPAELVARLCRELDLIHCVDPFKNRPLYGEIQYFRLHGIGGYNYRYSDAELDQLAQWGNEKATYLLFNNVWMKEDALRFTQRWAGQH